jgi:hypothetical protein
MKEAKDGKIKIEDFDATTIDLLLKWIYTEDIELKDVDFDDLLKLFQAAHKYCIGSLKDFIVAQIMTHHSTLENSLPLLGMGRTYEDETMVAAAKSIIKR